jgi:hypothetical protein
MPQIINTNKQPSNYHDGFYIHTSSSLMNKCDLDNEFDNLNQESSKRMITREGLEINMAIMINYLTHHVTNCSLTSIKCRDLSKISTTYYYKLCISILKRKKILFIRGLNGKESYLAGKYYKDYKFNYNVNQLDYDIAHRVKITDPRTIKKVSNNDELAIPLQFGHRYVRRLVPYTRLKTHKLLKFVRTVVQKLHNAISYKKYVKQGIMFIEAVALDRRKTFVKNTLNKKLFKSTGFRLTMAFLNKIQPYVINKLELKIKYLSQRMTKWKVWNELDRDINDKYGMSCVCKPILE